MSTFISVIDILFIFENILNSCICDKNLITIVGELAEWQHICCSRISIFFSCSITFEFLYMSQTTRSSMAYEFSLHTKVIRRCKSSSITQLVFAMRYIILVKCLHTLEGRFVEWPYKTCIIFSVLFFLLCLYLLFSLLCNMLILGFTVPLRLTEL